MMSTPLNKSALLAALAVTYTMVDIDGIGTVRLKKLSVAEADDAGAKAAGNGNVFGLSLVAYSVVDEQDQPVFSVSDLQPLQAASSVLVSKLVSEVLKFNGYRSADDEEPAGNVSGSTPTA